MAYPVRDFLPSRRLFVAGAAATFISAATARAEISSGLIKGAMKRFKITEDDWRNREKWDAYQTAVCDMVDRTSTDNAPWTLVEANDKNYARIKVLKTLCERIEKAL